MLIVNTKAAIGLLRTPRSTKWYDADILCMEQYLNSINWNDFICYNSSAALAWSAFIDLLWKTIDEFAPHTVTRVQSGKRKSQPREVLKLIGKKRNLWRKLKNNPSSLQTQWEYHDCVHKYRDACFRVNKLVETRIIEAKNLGAFYKHLNKRIKHRSVIPTLISSKGLIIFLQK